MHFLRHFRMRSGPSGSRTPEEARRMATCPKGHTSVATDYCDECGTPIGAAPIGAAEGVNKLVSMALN